MLQLVKVVIVAFSFVYSASGADWTYAGQANWGDDCGGSRQSPIDIVTEDTVVDAGLDEGFSFTAGVGQMMADATLINKGYTFQLDDDMHPSGLEVSGNELPLQNYEFLQFHYHWGDETHGGSEHTLNGHRFPAEIHFVFKDTGSELADSNSLAVFGFFIDIAEDDTFSHDGQFGHIINLFQDVANADDAMDVNDTFTLADFFPVYYPQMMEKFYHYDGSLTTPPCLEVVNWHVFEEPLYVSQDQYDAFMEFGVMNTYRDVQPLNGRIVYRTSKASDVARLQATFALALVAVLSSVVAQF